VAAVVQQAVSAFLAGEARDPRIGFVTVTGVTVSPDLSHAKVAVSVMGADAERERTLEGLASAAGHIRSQLARQLATRVTPDLVFVLDRGLEHAARIDRVLRDLRTGPAGGEPEAG
jgi:ribosome-binding factor A